MNNKDKAIFGFLGIVILSIFSLIYNFYIMYKYWPSEMSWYDSIQTFMLLWYRWMPSILSFLCGYLCFMCVYKRGSIKKALDNFVQEQGNRK